MKRIVIITNIPSPYRIYLFNKMSAELKNYNFELFIIFLNKMEKRRVWSFDEKTAKFKYIIHSAKYIKINTLYLYYGSELFKLINKLNPNILILGGSWHYPILFPFYISRKYRSITVIWTEINKFIKSIKLIRIIRNMIYKIFDKFIVPGYSNELYIKAIKKNANIIRLPNMIDEERFRRQTIIRKSIASILIVSRMENCKNIYNIVKSLVSNNKMKSLRITIIGKGPLQSKIKKLIAHKNNIQYYERVDYSDMSKYYLDSDLFILGSYKDPSPLSVIEGIRSGNVILVSNRIGNITEVFSNNGLSFNPYNISEFEEKINTLIRMSNEEIYEMKMNSLKLYEENFNCIKVVKQFSKELSSYYEHSY